MEIRRASDFMDEVLREFKNQQALAPLRADIHNAGSWNERLSAIRALYKALEQIGEPWPDIDPYSLELDQHWTPIEWSLWKDIRSSGCKFLPQFPAGRFFLDFADPVNKIGLEADGKQYHDADRDRARDQELWGTHGWRIFRVTGAETFRVYRTPDEFRSSMRELDQRPTVDELERVAIDFYTKSSQGVVRAVRDILIDKRIGEFCGVQVATLRAHRLADFPVGV